MGHDRYEGKLHFLSKKVGQINIIYHHIMISSPNFIIFNLILFVVWFQIIQCGSNRTQ